MENATKALIMAATILISVVIVSLGLFLAFSFGQYSSQIDKENRTNQIAQFNSQFLKYKDTEVTIHEILTVANLARENNQKYELTRADAGPGSLYITVEVERVNAHFEENSTVFANDYQFMQDQIINGELKKYTCVDVRVSENTERVYYLKFKET